MLIFVAGVHGVGKGYLCERHASNNNMLYKSASEIIKENSGIDLSQDKLTSDINQNQKILISALNEFKKNNKDLLLDGHFALVNKSGDITPLPLNIFDLMKIDAVILIENEKEIITQRILNRDGKQPLYSVEELMTAEINNAKFICNKLDIPLKVLMAPTFSDFDEAVKNVGRRT